MGGFGAADAVSVDFGGTAVTATTDGTYLTDGTLPWSNTQAWTREVPCQMIDSITGTFSATGSGGHSYQLSFAGDGSWTVQQTTDVGDVVSLGTRTNLDYLGSTATFANGDGTCGPNGAGRAATVSFAYADVADVQVSEPEMCVYALTVALPQCDSGGDAAVVIPPPPPPPPPPPTSAPSPTPVQPAWDWDLGPPTRAASTAPAQKIGGGAAFDRPLRLTKRQTVENVGGGMTCKKQPAGTGSRYICN